MSINRHSILFLVSLFFSTIFIVINILLFLGFKYIQKEWHQEQFRQFLLAHKIMHNEESVAIEHLLIKKSSISSKTLLKEGKVVDELPFAKMISLDGELYFIHIPPPPLYYKGILHMPPPPYAFRDEVLQSSKKSNTALVFGVFFIIDMLVLVFFIYLIKKLIPLYNLKNAIAAFREGDTHLNVKIDTDDEVSQITKEFNNVIAKIASIKEARTLFLRNIIHELKTPIMKGLLISEDLEQKRLKQIFDRMNYLLDEFSKIERFGSGEWELNIAKYRFVDILDHSIDILMCDKKMFIVEGKENELSVDADFELFSIAIKNLLDNALRYSKQKPIIKIKKDAIEICSYSSKIEEQKIDFSKPFNREYENSSSGLGLGLYLSNSVLRKHGFELKYIYKDEYNCFAIFFKGDEL